MAPMIARTATIPAARYLVGHGQGALAPMSRRTWNGTWLVIALVVIGLVATRYARSFGLFGIIATILLVVGVIAILRVVGPALAARSRPPAAPPTPRDVTPHEAALAPSRTISARPTPAPVVVVEPAGAADAGARAGAADSVEARLATLDRLRDDGRLTDAEYETKRAQLIAEL
jgi:hypothetical protein